MPRDYKNTQRRNTRSKPASPPRWRGFVAGFACGVVASVAVLVADRFNLMSFVSSSPGRPIAQASESSADAPRELKKPHFEFYTMLPEVEVAVQEEEIESRVAPDSATATAEPLPLKGSYLLQVGSFRKHEDADALKASLALLGLEADIQTVSINGEETWHRVRVGPFEQRDALNQARQRLAENNIEVMVFKKRG